MRRIAGWLLVSCVVVLSIAIAVAVALNDARDVDSNQRAEINRVAFAIDAISSLSVAQLRAAGAARWPIVNASANFNRSIGMQGYGALFDPNPFDQNFGFGLSFSLPLFSQYQTSQRIAQARVATDNVEERARQMRLQIDREVRTAIIELERAYHAVDLNRTSTDLARRRLELANERYRLGGLSFAELQQIIESAATAEREALDATYAFAAALATLEERVGRVER